jgi:hypothetical protein
MNNKNNIIEDCIKRYLENDVKMYAFSKSKFNLELNKYVNELFLNYLKNDVTKQFTKNLSENDKMLYRFKRKNDINFEFYIQFKFSCNNKSHPELFNYVATNFIILFEKMDEFYILNEEKDIKNIIKNTGLTKNQLATELYKYYFANIFSFKQHSQYYKYKKYINSQTNITFDENKKNELINIYRNYELSLLHIYLDYNVEIHDKSNENKRMLEETNYVKLYNKTHSMRIEEYGKSNENYTPRLIFNWIDIDENGNEIIINHHLYENCNHCKRMEYDDFIEGVYKFILSFNSII